VKSEVEKVGQLKEGHSVNSVWFCDDYFKKSEDYGKASSADVSPNTPQADEADIM
jgi:hypothetical protein